MTIYVPNLTFEDELNGQTNRSRQTQRAVDELGPLMALLAQPGDIVCVERLPGANTIPDCLQHVSFQTPQQCLSGTADNVVPWGWTNQVRSSFSIGCENPNVPHHKSVLKINSRSFNQQFDVQITANERTSSFGHFCFDSDEWSFRVEKLAEAGFDRWVTKPQISHAGRNRLLGQGSQLNQQQVGWLDRQFQNSGSVYVEPWVDRIEDCGLQFQISENSGVEFVGVTKLLNDKMGRYAGSVICCPQTQQRWQTEWDHAIQHGHTVCQAALESGYTGPLGIDAFRFRDIDGQTATRVCNDINGRFTMGRAALQLRSLLQPGEFGVWCQISKLKYAELRAKANKMATMPPWHGVRMVETSPFSIASQPVHIGTLLLIAEDLQKLIQFREQLETKTVVSDVPTSSGNSRDETT